MKRWRKLGRIFVPDGSKPWMSAYAANPVAEHVNGDRFRIYFSSRDAHNRSSIAFVEIALSDPATILCEAETPVLGPGEAATFDDAGVSIGCLLRVGSVRYLYYMGWHLDTTVPWRNTIGLAIEDEPNGTFRRASTLPVVPLSRTDPHTLSYPWVRHESGTFRMWYGSSTEWGPRKTHMRHVIKYAESGDGIVWNPRDLVAIDAEEPGEYAICRPCVLADADRYRMWYCSRGPAYRIRYAESVDGIVWIRRIDWGGLTVSVEGWDSEMIEYPYVFDHGGRRYLLYAGNGYGRTGFGLAILEDTHALT